MLTTPIYKLTPITETQIKGFANLGIETFKDLLFHFPRKYLDTRNPKLLKDWSSEENSLAILKIIDQKLIRTRYGKSFVITTVSDSENTMAEIMWFGQTFMLKALKIGEYYLMYGKLANDSKSSKYKLSITEYELMHDGKSAKHLDRIMPIYPLTEGLTSKLIRYKIRMLFSNTINIYAKLKELEYLDKLVIYKYDLLTIADAIKKIHFPESFEDIEQAKSRLGFDEIYQILLQVEKNKQEQEKYPANKFKLNLNELSMSDLRSSEFIFNLKKVLNFNFDLTKSQQTVIKEITNDMMTFKPMHRLLQGDVGSGKTIVAAISALICLENGRDVVLLCPTTILAKQHFETINEFFKNKKYNIDLYTGFEKYISKSSDIPRFLIGTHSLLFQNQELYTNLGLVIIDEQHRFGVEQREQLLDIVEGKKQKISPHYLMLTATPIPRSVAQIYYADLDISYLESDRTNKSQISTFVVKEDKREDMYKWIKTEIEKGGQAYIVCPLIDESDKLGLKNVKKEYEEIKKIYQNSQFNIELLHGKLKEKDKQKIIDKFENNECQILVTTQVIEVGVNIPNANIIIIESAERFGLAQLHQLRGRVGRGERKSYCFVLETPKEELEFEELLFENEDNIEGRIDRLEYFATHSNGMELSEYDMIHRGTGDIAGNSQSGIPKLRFARIDDLELVKKVKNVIKEQNI